METLLNPDRETAVNGSADMSEDGVLFALRSTGDMKR
jgi:hypothetical protein